MAGFDNDVVYAKNGDFTQADNNNVSESNGLITNGQLWIGSTALNAGGTHINVGTLTSPDNSITFGYSSPNITAVFNPSVVPDLHVARYIVASSTSGTGANYTTITSAIAAAVSSGVNSTIAIQPGTYTESFTLPPNINLVAFVADAYTPNVTIIGTITMTAAGSSSISGIRLQTNSANFLAVTGSANSVVNLINCYLNITNNTGINYTSSGVSSGININNCLGNIGTTGITCFTHSGAGQMVFNNSIITNNGQSSTASTCSSGSVALRNSRVGFAITTSSTASFVSDYSFHESPSINLTMLTLGGNGAVQRILKSYVGSGTSSAISIGSGVTVIGTDITTNSSNANAITGAGTLNYSLINSVSGTTLAMNVTGTTSYNNMVGSISFDKGANYLDTYTTGTWTPQLAASGTAFGSITFSNQVGYYTKIGDMAYVTGYVSVSAFTLGAATGGVQFKSLPFTSKNVSNLFWVGPLRLSNTTFTADWMQALVNNNSVICDLQIYRSANAASNLAVAGMSATTDCIASVFYKV